MPVDVVDEREPDESEVEDQGRRAEDNVPTGVLAEHVAEGSGENHDEQHARREREDRPFSGNQKTRGEKEREHVGVNRWSLQHIERIGSPLRRVKPDVR